jgi:uncharacterized protein YbaR (Trm112 family)
VNTHLLDPFACPVCHAKLSAATNALPHEACPPRTGDFTVCLHCNTILAFTEGGAVRFLRPGEFRKLHPSNQCTLLSIRQCISELAARRGKSYPSFL